MPLHARPHLSTHTRGHGQSSVAGAAYRLGIRLVDRRTGLIHDYSRRERGDEIVRTLTVAPPGAPGWATDPDVLWNAVESNEKRKDSQLARDFRIPIPIGLSDQQAGDLAEDMARYISTVLQTPVSMGLHRDNDRDVVGELKRDGAVGFHAHLYFPTRKIQCWTGEGDPPTALGLGEKFTELAYKKTSGPVVEMLNARWAEIANSHLAEAGLTPDRDHRSYVRLGIDKKREPKVSQAAAAKERRGLFTDEGDLIRQIRMPAPLAELTDGELASIQHRQAQADRMREVMKAYADAPDEIRDAQARGTDQGAHAALVDRFAAALPAPTVTTRASFVKLLAVMRRIQRVLAILVGVVPRLETMRDSRRRTSLAHWQAQRDMDDLGLRHAAAVAALEGWLRDHRWRLRFRGLMGAARPPRLDELERRETQERSWLKEAQLQLRRTAAQDEASLRRLQHFERLQAKAQVRLEQGLVHLSALDPGAASVLLTTASTDQRPWVEQAMPPAPDDEQPAPPEPAVAYHQEGRPRLRPRPGG
ncbi:MobA/MobL family protein [Luteibacter yeojuensis]|uniref:MobA/MobL protein domain-containing protein n=1 Tax=Luteibacter yeojuensis TaxID=345309 RepID=A0A0F3L0A4_9GAMM|nr:MobA/MobL family protein [Luteibacter yeojuensis]KJV36970.1 hypothetical protein VI08_01895 [Luteibacter yeojuensis]